MCATKSSGKGASNRRSLPRTALPQETFVLIELPSGEERLEPLLDLSPTGVALLVRAQRSVLQPGVVLRRVRFFTNGECTLETRAIVRDVQPTTLDDGSFGTKLGLRLTADVTGNRGTEPTQEYTEAPIISDAVANLLAAKAAIRIDLPSGPTSLVLTRADSRSHTLLLTLTSDSAPTIKRGREIELATEIYGTRIAAVVKYRERRGDELRTSWPSRIKVWKHRAGGRLKKLPRDLTVSFESPFVAGEITRPVVDLAPKGIAFISASEDGLLVGMLLRALTLKLPNGTISSQAVVKNVRRHEEGGFTTGIELTDVSDNAMRLLAEFVDLHFHPEVTPARPDDLLRLWPLYDVMGLFPRAHAALSPTTPSIEASRVALLNRGRGLHLQMLAGGSEQLLATAELLRTYGNTWSLQQVGVRPNSNLSADVVVVPLVEVALRRTDFTHLHAILDPTQSRDGLDKLLALTPTPDSLVIKHRMLVGAAPEAQPNRAPVCEVQEAQAPDLDWVAARLAELTTPLEAIALRLSPSELRLEETGRAFHAVGLWRERQVRLAMSVGGPLGFSLVERFSPGLSFAGHADLVRLFALKAAHATRRATLLSLALDAAQLPSGGERRRVLYLVSKDDAQLLTAAGFTLLGERLEIVASRDGAQRVVNCLNLLS